MSLGAVIAISLLFICGSIAIRGLRRWMRWRMDALKPTNTDQPPVAGDCPQCGYDLTGLTSVRCPECGYVVPKRIPVNRAEQDHRLAQAREKVAAAYEAKRKEQ